MFDIQWWDVTAPVFSQGTGALGVGLILAAAILAVRVGWKHIRRLAGGEVYSDQVDVEAYEKDREAWEAYVDEYDAWEKGGRQGLEPKF